jgi:uncharacterized membrane protein
MTVDEALKYIISMGVVAPRPHARPLRGATPDTSPAPAAATPSEIRN